MSAPAAGRPAPRRRPDESMTLLTEMMQRPLDPGYAAAAAKREAAGLPPATGHRSALLVVAALLIGLLFAMSALALRAPATSASRAKAQLIDQIESRRAHGDQQTAGSPPCGPRSTPPRAPRCAGRARAAWPTTCAGSSWSPAPRR